MRKMRSRFEPMTAREEARAVYTCTACSEGIYRGDSVNDVDGEMYHEDCWSEQVKEDLENAKYEFTEKDVCNDCADPFETGHRAVLVEGKVYCYECAYEAAFDDISTV